MAVGKQDETVIVHWHPGESVGVNGLGAANAALPISDAADESTTASGLRTFFDTRVDTEATARAAVNTRVSTLGTRIVASGVLPTSV